MPPRRSRRLACRLLALPPRPGPILSLNLPCTGPAQESNNLPLRGAKFGVFEGSFRVPALLHSPLLPAAAVGKGLDETVYVSDWYVTLALRGGVPASLIHGASSGPVAPDGMDMWPTLIGAGANPAVASPRTMIVHEYDDKQGIYAIRSGDWKLIWGKVGTDEWIADVDYGSGCSTLLPPVNGSVTQQPATQHRPAAPGPAAVEGRAGKGEDQARMVARKPKSGLVCNATSPCLFDVVADPNEHRDPLATASVRG